MVRPALQSMFLSLTTKRSLDLTSPVTGADSSIEGDQIRFQVVVLHLAEEVKSLLALLSGSLDGWLPEFLT